MTDGLWEVGGRSLFAERESDKEVEKVALGLNRMSEGYLRHITSRWRCSCSVKAQKTARLKRKDLHNRSVFLFKALSTMIVSDNKHKIGTLWFTHGHCHHVQCKG